MRADTAMATAAASTDMADTTTVGVGAAGTVGFGSDAGENVEAEIEPGSKSTGWVEMGARVSVSE